MTESSRSKSHVPVEDSIPQASLESILCTEELHRRPWRSPDYEKENRALVALVGALADSPCATLQTLAETILDITQCDSAGLSLLTREFRSESSAVSVRLDCVALFQLTRERKIFSHALSSTGNRIRLMTGCSISSTF